MSSLTFGLLLGLGACSRAVDSPPNILLITLDTTRLDHLGCYGYDKPTSPNLDRLAAESVLYRRAIATSSWTLPSHSSLVTGKYTTSHGARYDPQGPLRLRDAISGPESWDQYRARGLSSSETTLAGILRQSGYATGAVVAGPWMKEVFGLASGFDHYDDSDIGTVNGRSAASVTDGAWRWLEQTAGQEFFLFLNYYDPHGPLTPPRELAMKFQSPGTQFEKGKQLTKDQYLALYDAEIFFMDQQIGRLFQKLRDNGIYDKTWIIVTADHGELFGEHGKIGHGHHLFQEEIHVPLLMKYPAGEQSPQARDELVSLTDILPMICRRLDLEVPEGVQGGVPEEGNRPIIAETYPLQSFSGDGSWRTLLAGDFKLLWNSDAPARLYDLGVDPAEQNDLAASDPERTSQMLTQLDDYLAALPRPGDAGPEQELDEETSKALESLGYVD